MNQAVPPGGQGTQNRRCVACGEPILPGAPAVDGRYSVHHAECWYHPGCKTAEQVSRLSPSAREHLAAARAALARPTDRRSA